MEDNQMSIPNLFRCPISLDLFTDPVSLTTGQTYDRPSIEKWLSAGHLTCPLTMQKLENISFVPNHNLRHLINQWLLHGITDHHGDLAASLVALKSYIQSSLTPLAALRKVKLLSTESEMGKSQLIKLGFFPHLLKFALQSPLDSTDVIELTLDCILALSPPSIHPNSLNFLQQDAAFSSLVTLMEQGNSKIKKSLCLVLETISVFPTTQHIRILFGQSRELLRSLTTLLRTDPEAAAAAAISAICVAEESRANAIREGAVSGLVLYLSTSVRRNASTALAAMEGLMGLESGRRAAVESGGVRVIVRWVFSVSFGGEESEKAVGVLLALCRWSAAARMEAVGAGVVAQLLLLLQSRCSVEAKGMSIALLKLFGPGNRIHGS